MACGLGISGTWQGHRPLLPGTRGRRGRSQWSPRPRTPPRPAQERCSRGVTLRLGGSLGATLPTALRHPGKFLAHQPGVLGLVGGDEAANGGAPGTTRTALTVRIKACETLSLSALPTSVDRSHVGADGRIPAATLIGAPGRQPLAVLAVAGEPALALVEVLG